MFANHGDGTYSQVDETHAHLNIPATFMFAPAYRKNPVQIKIHPRKDLNWKVATQLKPLTENEYYAPDLDYFMDSPIEISDHQLRSFKISTKDKDYDIKFVLHQIHGYDGFDAYFEKVKKIVKSEIEVFGTLPDFDFGSGAGGIGGGGRRGGASARAEARVHRERRQTRPTLRLEWSTGYVVE